MGLQLDIAIQLIHTFDYVVPLSNDFPVLVQRSNSIGRLIPVVALTFSTIGALSHVREFRGSESYTSETADIATSYLSFFTIQYLDDPSYSQVSLSCTLANVLRRRDRFFLGSAIYV